MKSRDERLAENELLFRQVNERIIELGEQWGSELDLVCECANKNCARVIVVGVEEYERVRENAARFIVLPGHEVVAIEAVVETTASYLVVEKHAELLRKVETGTASDA